MTFARYGRNRPSSKSGLHQIVPMLAILVLLLMRPGQARAEAVLLALGDSLTQGYGLNPEEGFVPQLERWLTARGHDVKVINGGVSGDTSAGGLARVAWSLTPETSAMIVALGGNDLLRGVPPEVTRANIRGILDVAQANDIEVLLVGMQAPGNYGPDYKAKFDALYPELAAEYNTLHQTSFFEGLAEAGDLALARERMQADGIHPNAEGVRAIVETMGPRVEALLTLAMD